MEHSPFRVANSSMTTPEILRIPFSSHFAQDPAVCPRADPAQSSPPNVPVNLTVHVTRDTAASRPNATVYSLFFINEGPTFCSHVQHFLFPCTTLSVPMYNTFCSHVQHFLFPCTTLSQSS